MRWLAILAAAIPAHARADRPAFAVLAGPAIRHVWIHTDTYPYSADVDTAAFVATAGWRVDPHVVLGVHGGVSTSNGGSQELGNTVTSRDNWSVVSTDVAFAVQYENGPFTIAPWLGRHFTRFRDDDTECVGMMPPIRCTSTHALHWTSDFASYGVSASIDVDRTVPIAVFLDLQTGTGGAPCGRDLPSCGFSSASFGIAYRR